MIGAHNRKRQRVLVLVAGTALLAAVFLVWSRGPKEPVYQGKALTQWINEAHDIGIFEQTDELNAAMVAFGTNAVPFLLHEFTRPVSPGWNRLRVWINSYSSPKIHLRTDKARIYVAGQGLMLLGSNAAPALPVLAPYLDDPKLNAFVLGIFEFVGDAALPYITAGLGSTNAAAITNGLRTLQVMAHHSVFAQEKLTAALNDPSPRVRSAAVAHWSMVLMSQVDIVPRLVTLASDASPLVREAATNQLAWLRREQEKRLGTVAEGLQKPPTNAVPATPL